MGLHPVKYGGKNGRSSLRSTSREPVSFWETLGFGGIPPSLKAATGARFAKMACKILSPKDLEVKILRTKELRPFLWRYVHGFRLDDDLLFGFWGQDWMSPDWPVKRKSKPPPSRNERDNAGAPTPA